MGRVEIEVASAHGSDKSIGRVTCHRARGQNASCESGATYLDSFTGCCCRSPYTGNRLGEQGMERAGVAPPEPAVGFVEHFNIGRLNGQSRCGLEGADDVFVNVGGHFGPGHGIAGVVGPVVTLAQPEIDLRASGLCFDQCLVN